MLCYFYLKGCFMNFSIHIDDRVASQLVFLSKKTKKTRNALINQAIRFFLETQNKSEWPKAVRELAGSDHLLTPFENHRQELAPLKEDPME